MVVVGGRCAGAATALGLARSGRTVLLLDKARYGSDTVSTHALLRSAILLLDRWGVLPAVRAAGTPRVTRVVYHYRDETVEIPLRTRGSVDGLYAPRRHVLDAILADAAAAAGVDVRHRTVARDVLRRDGRAVGVVVDDGGRLRQVATGLVVGGDGASSMVADRVGARVELAGRHAARVIYCYQPGLPSDAYRNYFAPGTAAGVIPTSDGAANVWVAEPRSDDSRAGRWLPSDFDRLLTRAAPNLAEELRERIPSTHFTAFRGRRGYARTSAGPGWALVGDAASFSDPVGSHGITDAFVAAELLVSCLAAAATDDEGLVAYDRCRRTVAWPLIGLVDDAAGLDSDPVELRRTHRAINEVMRAEWNAIQHPAPMGQLSTNDVIPPSMARGA